MKVTVEGIRTVVLEVAEGAVSEADLEAADGVLLDAGISSVEVLALIERLELDYGVIVDAEDYMAVLETLATIADFVNGQLATVEA